MKEKDEVTKERDVHRAQFKLSLEERDLQLLDVLIDSIKKKSSHQKVDLLCKIIDIVQTKNKQKRDIALQMIMDNHKMSEETQKSNRDHFSKQDKEKSEELLKILAGDVENKDEQLILYVKNIKKKANQIQILKKISKLLIGSWKKLDEKNRTEQLKKLIDTVSQIDNQERTDLLSIMIEKVKLEEWHVSELNQKTRANKKLSNQNESLNLAADEFDASIQSYHTQSSKEAKR